MRRALGLSAGLACAFALVASAAHADPAPTAAPADRTLEEARAEESATHYLTALAKYRSVLSTRDTPAVHLRIATCLEALGELRSAAAEYSTLADADAKAEPDVVSTARQRLAHLETTMGRARITTPPNTPAKTEVRIDDRTVSSAEVRKPIFLPPGIHTVTASAPNLESFRTDVVIAAGASIDIPIKLAPPAGASAAAQPNSSRHTLGYAMLAGGGALLAGSVVLIVLRQNDLALIHDACPRDQCPVARREDLMAARDRVFLETPFALGMGVASLAALGLGGYFIVSNVSASPTIGTQGSGLAIHGRF